MPTQTQRPIPNDLKDPTPPDSPLPGALPETFPGTFPGALPGANPGANSWAIRAGHLFPPAPPGWSYARLKPGGPPLPYPLTGRANFVEMGLILAGYLGDLRSQAYYFKLMTRWQNGSLCPGQDRAKLWHSLRDKAIELGQQRWPHGDLARPGAVFCTWLKLVEKGGGV